MCEVTKTDAGTLQHAKLAADKARLDVGAAVTGHLADQAVQTTLRAAVVIEIRRPPLEDSDVAFAHRQQRTAHEGILSIDKCRLASLAAGLAVHADNVEDVAGGLFRLHEDNINGFRAAVNK